MIDRRTALHLTAGIAGAGASPVLGQTRQASLAEGARTSGLTFGSAVRLEQLTADADLSHLLLDECSGFTPEIGLKWAVIEPERGRLEFGDMDQMALICAARDKQLRGHALIWHRSIPSWASEALQSFPDWRLISRYFSSVIPRFGDTVHAWDVVNEPIETGHRMDGLRQSPFLEAFGPDYIPRAFSEARLYAPQAKLYLNDYNLEYDNEEQRARRYLLLKLIERLKSKGVPIDGLGLQSHLNLGLGQVSDPALTSFIKDVEGFGLELAITELDVREVDYTLPAAARDQRVADEVERYLDIVLPTRGVVGVTTWGLSDRSSWLGVKPSDLARFPGAWRDGSSPGLNRGLPCDANLNPKPFFFVLRDALTRRGASRQKLR